MKIIFRLILVAAFGFLSIVSANAEKFVIDSSHSSVEFKVKHLMISKVRGNFEKFEGWIEYDAGDTSVWDVEAKIDLNSVNTSNSKRDAHLRNKDFFHVDKYPEMTFKLSKVYILDGGKKKIRGDLTLHGVTRSVILDLEGGHVIKDPWGNTKTGFSASTTIDRTDFGLTYNKALEAGGVMIGEEVEIEIEIEAVVPREKPKKKGKK